MTLNTRQIEALKGSGTTKQEPVSIGGSLQVRGLRTKVMYYYCYRHEGSKLRYPLGVHSRNGDSTGSKLESTFTLVGARKRATELAALQRTVGNLSSHYENEKRKAGRERAEARQMRIDDERDARDFSLEQLCNAYVNYLQDQGKKSANEARQLLTRWAVEKHPDIASKKARDVSTDDIMVILRHIVSYKHTTTTNRVRSYLMAAYAFGAGSATDPLASEKANGFRLLANPVSPTKRVAQFEKVGERTLSVTELCELLRRLDEIDKPAAKAVLLSLRLGGQRMRQLLSAENHDTDAQTLTLLDPKGRRAQARRHILPVVEQALPLLEDGRRKPNPQRPGLWGGLTQYTVSKLITRISKEMAEELGTESFTMRDLRRTTETQLASVGISKDIRGQILSHGLSGVQERHYDRHDYMQQKRKALVKWNRQLDCIQASRF